MCKGCETYGVRETYLFLTWQEAAGYWKEEDEVMACCLAHAISKLRSLHPRLWKHIVWRVVHEDDRYEALMDLPGPTLKELQAA